MNVREIKPRYQKKKKKLHKWKDQPQRSSDAPDISIVVHQDYFDQNVTESNRNRNMNVISSGTNDKMLV